MLIYIYPFDSKKRFKALKNFSRLNLIENLLYAILLNISQVFSKGYFEGV